MKPLSPVDSNPARQGWRTPPKLVEYLKQRYDLQIDIAADKTNSVLSFFYDYSAGQDALLLPWPSKWFCNPPWDNITPFINKAVAERTPGVMLVPGRVNTRWFFKAFQAGAKFKFFVGRLRYDPPPGVKEPSPSTESMMLLFGYPRDAEIDFLFARDYSR